MNLIILARYWQYIVMAILTLLLLFATSSCSNNAKEIKAIKTEHRLTLVTEQAAYELRARKIERESYEQVIQAVNDGKAREKSIAVDVANANDANGRLHATIDRLNATTSDNSAARAEYTASVSELFKSCTSIYLELAEKADGHVNDIRTLQQANKRK